MSHYDDIAADNFAFCWSLRDRGAFRPTAASCSGPPSFSL